MLCCNRADLVADLYSNLTVYHAAFQHIECCDLQWEFVHSSFLNCNRVMGLNKISSYYGSVVTPFKWIFCPLCLYMQMILQRENFRCGRCLTRRNHDTVEICTAMCNIWPLSSQWNKNSADVRVVVIATPMQLYNNKLQLFGC